MTFPLSPAPAGFASFAWSKRRAFYQPGDSPTATISSAAAATYAVKDIDGNTVRSGPVTGTTLNIGAWTTCGWFLVELYKSGSPDATWGMSLGMSCFSVAPPDTNFEAMPAVSYPSNGAPGHHGDFIDPVSRACLGMGPYRLSIIDAANPNGGSVDNLPTAVADMAVINQWLLQSAKYDVARGVKQFLQFPNGTVDFITLATNWLRVYIADLSADGATTWVRTSPGTTSGAKVEVLSGATLGAATVVETFDNIASASAADTTINAGSAYIRVFVAGPSGALPSSYTTGTAIGRTRRDGIALCVSTLYPLGCTHFEGHRNEPDMSSAALGRETAHADKIFAQEVHAGNASAKALGPIMVSIDGSLDTGINAWIAAGGPGYLDGIDFHDYNSFANSDDVNNARYVIESFVGRLEAAGYGALPKWQTEATHAKLGVSGNVSTTNGVFHPRRARQVLLRTLTWEQYGTPRERNPYWYEFSHGFWSYPAFWVNGDSSALPQAALLFTLARETYGLVHEHRIDFGSIPANRILVGSTFGNPGGSVAVFLAASPVPGGTVVFDVHGTATSLTVVDAWGNTSTPTVTAGQISVAVSDLPTYVRLPAGVYLSVSNALGHGTAPPPNVAMLALEKSLGGAPAPGIADDTFITRFTGGSSSPGYNASAASLPDDAYVKWTQNVSVERVIVWCGPPFQTMTVLVDFDIDTWDGTTWTTRKTVTDATPTSYVHGSDSTGPGTQRSTFWPERWVFDEALTAPITCKGVRIHVRAISYGGEPDAAAAATNNQGAATPKLGLVELATLSPTTMTLGTAWSPAVLALTPEAYWRLGDAASATTAVAAVNAPTLNGTPINGPTFGVPGLVQSDNDTAVSFNGASVQRIQVASDTSIRLGDVFTIGCLFVPGLAGSTQTILGKNGSYGIQQGSDNTFRLANPGIAVIAASTVALTAGTAYFLIATKNGSDVHLYVNAVDVTGTITNATLTDNGNPLTIAANGASTQTTGIIDEVFLLKGRVLTPTQVSDLFKSFIAPGIPQLTKAPVVEGPRAVGRQMGAVPGAFAKQPTARSYQWQQSADGSTGWANLAGETRADLIVPGSVAGRWVRAQETATNAAGSSTAAPSAPVQIAAQGTIGELVGVIPI